MFVIINKKKYEAMQAGLSDLINRVAIIETSLSTPSPITEALNNGNMALTEAREMRERIWPLFSQGEAANLKMIEKVAKLPE